MLLALTIEKFALVDQLYLEFSEGLNIMTGETGAGKSIVIHALAFVLGGRSSKEMIQSGADMAKVEAAFLLSAAQREKLSRLEVETEEVMSLQRSVKTSGSSICRINGKIVPLSMLKDVSALLLEIHGQHENQLLFQKNNHLLFLDEYGKKELQKPLEQYHAAYLQYGKLKKKMISDEMNPQLVSGRIETLSEQLDEFAALKWQQGEEAALNEQVAQMSNYELIAKNIEKAYQALYQSENSVMAEMSNAVDAFLELKEIHSDYGTLHSKLGELYFGIEDVMLSIRDMRSGSGYSQEELERAQKRLFEFSKMKKKYGGDEEAVLSYFAEAKEELEELSDRLSHAQEYRERLQEYFNIAKKAAKNLSDTRKAVAQQLERDLLAQLADLGMGKSQFKVYFTQRNLNKTGLDDVEFLFSANAGEEVKPMNKVASGGEISRLMLALKNIDLKHSLVDSMVFDEIDTGISGKMAQAVAQKLSNIAKENQVICITHLPQVAAMNDRHFLVEKSEKDGKTRVQAYCLDEKERTRELARLISGSEITDTGLIHAKELQASAQNYKLGR